MIGSETGLHDVYLDAYWIDKYEVTNAQYELCVENGACSEPLDLSSSTRDSYYVNPEYADYPVINVIVPQAKDYCEWVGGSLPTEAQWEKAAHGLSEQAFPWGNDAPTCELANFNSGGEPCVGDTAPVGSYPDGVSPYGAMDMAGNVTEWVLDGASLQGPGGYDVSGAINPFFVGDGLCHFHRGGDWYLDTFNIRSQRRLCSQSNTLDDIYTFGFRCMMAP
jgi:formylglycine-generating enzyme required for sulfatase activity